MLKTGLGVLLAAIAVFLWGFFYYGSKVIDHFSHMTPAQEATLVEALKANLPSDGVYTVPDSKNGTEEEMMARAASGPIAFMNFRNTGVPAMGVTLAMGFVHILVMAAILAAFLHVANVASFSGRMTLVALFGAAAAIYAQLGTPIWWSFPWSHAASAAFYDFMSYVIAGAILAYFIRPKAA
jgi:hypothetical protein